MKITVSKYLVDSAGNFMDKRADSAIQATINEILKPLGMTYRGDSYSSNIGVGTVVDDEQETYVCTKLHKEFFIIDGYFDVTKLLETILSRVSIYLDSLVADAAEDISIAKDTYVRVSGKLDFLNNLKKEYADDNRDSL